MKNLLTKEPAPKKPGPKRPKCSGVYRLRLTQPLEEKMRDLKRVEKRQLPDLVRQNIDRAIDELRRKRQTPDERRIKLL